VRENRYTPEGMKRFLLSCLGLLLAGALFAGEQSEQLALEYLELSRTPEMLKKTIDTYATRLGGGDPEKEKQMREKLEQEMGWNVLKQPIIEIVIRNLSDAQLKDINAFYRTPSGTAFATKGPDMSAELSEVIAANIKKATSAGARKTDAAE